MHKRTILEKHSLKLRHIYSQNNIMIKREELIAMRAITLCFKPFLKPEEACVRD
jgi:hypothetical protein